MLTSYIPLMHALLSSGTVKPSEYEIVGSGGFDGVTEAWAYQSSSKAGSKKVIVKLQDA